MKERRRDHDLPHNRTMEAQTLDALLRIEELLTMVLADKLPLNALKPEELTAKPKKPTKGVTRL